MSRSSAVVVAVLGTSLTAGCNVPGSHWQDAPVVKPAAVSGREAGALTADESRVACLGDGAGDATLGPGIREQKRAGELLSKPAAWVELGRQWVRKARRSSDPGFYLNAEACAEVALGIEPGFAQALELRGLALMNDHEFEQAQQLVETILPQDPDDVLALGTLSDALLELGRYEESAVAAQRQMSARPGMAAHARGSYHRWLLGDARHAKMLIKDALMDRDGRDPEPAAWTFVEAAAIYWHQADYAGADAVYAEALQWVPGYPPALLGRARIALAQGRARKAAAYLDEAIRVRATPEAFWLLGDARGLLGDDSGAAQAYDHVVELGRRGDVLTLALFDATKNRDIGDALRLIEAERATRGGIYVDDTYAWVLYRAGRLADARQASDRALRLGTKDARLLYHAGAIRMAAGDEAGGRALVRQALALNPQFDATGAPEARALLRAAAARVASIR